MTTSVLVAGGAGYIGAHVCKALAAAGFKPVVLDNFVSGHRRFVASWPLVEACVSNVEAVRQTVERYGTRAVIDLAGSIEVAESVKDPLKYYDNNMARKLVFLQTLARAGVRAFVFSSTAAVYGEPQSTPIPETHRLQPTSPYGWSKLMFERLLADFSAVNDLNYMALRYFNAAGASPEGDIGEAHEPETHLIPRACMAALGTLPPLTINGNDYPTPDGTAVRDYIHVCDLAQAHVLATQALLSGAGSAVYNLGTGAGTSIGQVLQTFVRLGYPVPHGFGARRAGDPSVLVADSSAARGILQWRPELSALETIIETAYRWHASQSSKGG